MASSLTPAYFLEVVGTGDSFDDRSAEIADLLKGAENKILAFTSPNGNPDSGVWVDSICSVIQLDMAKRAFKNPDSVSSDALGPSSRAFVAPGGLFLLPGEKEELQKLKSPARRGGLRTIGTSRGTEFSDSYLYL